MGANGAPLMRSSAPAAEQATSAGIPKDNTWLKQSFIVGSQSRNGIQSGLSAQDVMNRRFTYAQLSYTDSSIGGNKWINPLPQYTRYADIRHVGIHLDAHEVTIAAPKAGGTLGQGSYYNEAHDQNAQVIHLRFGVASYNSLTQFLTGFYSGEMAAAARAGRFTDDMLNGFFRATGNIIGLAIVPMFIVPIAFLAWGQATRMLANWPSSKFYTLKPTMPLYWNTVTSIVNQMAVNSGLSSFVDTNQSRAILNGGVGTTELTASTVANFVGRFLPGDILKPNGTIDVYAMANRANRQSIAFEKIVGDAFERAKGGAGSDDFFEVIRNAMTTAKSNKVSPVQPWRLEEYLSNFAKYDKYNRVNGTTSDIEKDFRQPQDKTDSNTTNTTDVPANAGTTKSQTSASGANYKPSTDVDPWINYLVSNFNDGSDYASFRVDYTGPVHDGFSSSVMENPLATKINSMSSQARSVRISMADGNINGVIGTAYDGIKSLLSGVAEVIQIEGLAAAAGSAFVDIPKNWESSTADLPKSTYSMTLISPYGNPISQLFNIWVPLSMLLAGALPLATGKQSHTSPFLCELHDRGRTMVQCGLIDSLSISRGTSNLGFTNEGKPLAIEVSFTVMDLSSIMAVPVQPGFSISSALGNIFDSENAFSHYLMTLAALNLSDVTYRVPLLRYQTNRLVADVQSFVSSSHIASYVASLPGVNLISAVMRGTDRL
jgi:hypothetical protein